MPLLPINQVADEILEGFPHTHKDQRWTKDACSRAYSSRMPEHNLDILKDVIQSHLEAGNPVWKLPLPNF